MNLTSLTVYGDAAPRSALDDAVTLYRAVYVDPPYCESVADIADFAASLPSRAKAPTFRLVIAYVESRAVGFAMGHHLAVGTGWWDGAQTALPADMTDEHEGRTFAVIEVAVLPEHRRQGIARALHTHLLAGIEAERATLLVRPEADAAHRAYEAWSYHTVGRIQPFPAAPIYDAMIRSLR